MNEIDNNKNELIEVANKLSSFESYLESFGLPTDNVIAPAESREQLAGLLPHFLNSLSSDVKKDARYLSKFIAAGAVGLYDAALNYLWDEVIINLRKKVIAYGLEYFYDNAIGASNRDAYKTEEDLKKVKDITLLDTCKKIELLTDILHKKLVYILDMRNNIGASHPNEYNISQYELMADLDICVKKVLLDKVSNAAVTIKSLCDNLVKLTSVISDEECLTFKKAIESLSMKMASNLLRRLFSMFTSSENASNNLLRQNIIKISQIIWNYSDDDAKYSIGEKIDCFTVNLEQDKAKSGELFLESCNGKNYYTKSKKSIKISSLCDSLEIAHNAYDNYYNEHPYAREIMSMIKKISDIPNDRKERLLTVFLKCDCGNGYTYCNGVSPSGKKYYDLLFSMADDETFKLIIRILNKNTNFLYGSIRTKNMKNILVLIKPNIISERLIEIIDKMINYKDDLDKIFFVKEFKELISVI